MFFSKKGDRMKKQVGIVGIIIMCLQIESGSQSAALRNGNLNQVLTLLISNKHPKYTGGSIPSNLSNLINSLGDHEKINLSESKDKQRLLSKSEILRSISVNAEMSDTEKAMFVPSSAVSTKPTQSWTDWAKNFIPGSVQRSVRAQVANIPATRVGSSNVSSQDQTKTVDYKTLVPEMNYHNNSGNALDHFLTQSTDRDLPNPYAQNPKSLSTSSKLELDTLKTALSAATNRIQSSNETHIAMGQQIAAKQAVINHLQSWITTIDHQIRNRY